MAKASSSSSRSSRSGSGEPTSDAACLCTALRRASRAVSRIYDDELRETGLRVTQFALLSLLGRSGEVRQSDLSTLTVLDETSLSRAIRVLVDDGWVAVRPGKDRREKWVALTSRGRKKLEQSRPAWAKAQERLKQSLPEGYWAILLAVLPKTAELTLGD